MRTPKTHNTLMGWLLVALVAVHAGAGCARPTPAYPPRAPLTRDPDRRPFAATLEPYFSAGTWDRWDKSIFRPVSRFFAVLPGGEATNVNAFDEVPDSSWFQNRSTGQGLTREEAALGACRPPLLDPSGPFRIVSGKPDGAFPGLIVKAPDDQRYLLKFERGLQSPQPIVADVVGSRIYYAAGFDVPCNSVVDFDAAVLRIAPGATFERDTGEEVPVSPEYVTQMLSKATHLTDGRVRAMASRFLEGKPLGPWRYHGTRDGDRNDIIPHEDRRELRGSRLLAAWTAHWDQREQNTLAMWIETSQGRGFVRHHLLDFGDCFGTIPGVSTQAVWRRGHAYWFEPSQVLADFFTLGLIERPWDRTELGPTGAVFAYYNVDQFDPEHWKTSYPNPAFGRMTERDAAWMARIIARIGKPQLEAMTRVARINDTLRSRLMEVLEGRREKILRRYLERLSPLAEPKVVRDGSRAWLCVTDLGVRAGSAIRPRAYSARAWRGMNTRPLAPLTLASKSPGEPCVLLPSSAKGKLAEKDYPYWIIEIATQVGAEPYPARIHVYERGIGDYLVVGFERPETLDAPN